MSTAAVDGVFVGVDVGGTFTDVVLAQRDGSVRIGKVLTTPEDPRAGVVEGIRTVLAAAGVAPGAVSRVVHGTTLATNVVIQRSGGPVALVTTRGSPTSCGSAARRASRRTATTCSSTPPHHRSTRA
jgi:N-methylhydantoinase A